MIAGQLEIQMLTDIARLQKDMDQVKRITDRTMQSVDKAVAGARRSIEGMFAGVSAAAFGMWIKGAIDFSDQLNDLNKTTMISVERLSGLSLMSKQTGSDLTGVAQSINKLSLEMGKDAEKFAKIGITAKDPLEAFKQMSEIFKQIEDPQLRAAFAAEGLGKAWASAAPALSEGSEEIQRMVDRGSALTGITAQNTKDADAFNDAVSELGAAFMGTATNLSSQMLPLLTVFVTELTDTTDAANKTTGGFDIFTETLRAFIVIGGNVAFVIKTMATEIGGISAQLVAFASGDFKGAAEIGRMMREDAAKNRASFDAWEQKMMSAGKTAKATAEATKAVTGGMDAAQIAALKAFIDAEKAGKAGKDAAKELKEENKLLAELAGLSGSFAEDWDRLSKLYGKGRISLDELTFAQAKLLAQQPFFREEQRKIEEESKQLLETWKEQDKAILENVEAYTKLVDAMDDQHDRTLADIKATKEQIERIGLSTRAIAALDKAKMDDAVASKLREAALWADIDLSGEMTKKLEGEAQALRDLGALRLEATTLQESFNQYKEMWSSIEGTAHTTFTNIFEGGSDVFKKLGQTLKSSLLDLLYQMTIKKWIFNIGANISGQANLGQDAGGGGGAGSLISAASNLSGIGGLGSIATAYTAGSSSVGVMAGSIAGGGGAMGGIASALGAVPVAGWVALAAFAVMSFMKKGGGPKVDGYSGSIISGIGATSNELGAGLAPGVASMASQYAAYNKAFGGKGGASFGIGVSTDPKGDAPTMLEIAASRNGAFVGSNFNRNVGRSQQELEAAIASGSIGIIVDALKASELPPTMAAFFDKIANDASSEVKQAALNTAMAVQTYTNQFKELGGVFANLGDIAVETRAALIDAAGGLEALTAQTTSYFSHFYSETERASILAGQVGDEMNRLGHSSVDTIGEFRTLVDSLDLSTASGASLFSALMKVEGAFFAVHGAAATAADSVVAVADTFVTDLQNNLVEGVRSARAALNQSYQEEVTRLKASEAAHRAYGKELQTFAKSLFIGDLSPLNDIQQQQVALNTFNEALAGGEDAKGALQSAATAFLQNLKATATTSEEYAIGFSKVQEGLRMSANVALASADLDRLQLNALTQEVSPMLGVIAGNTLSTRDAIINLQGAISAALAAGVSASRIGVGATGIGGAAGGNTATLIGLYDSLFDRAPDAEGLAYWNAVLNSGKDAAYVEQEMKKAAEYMPGHAAGLNYVPYDDYMFRAHEGEAVLNRQQANEYRSGSGALEYIRLMERMEAKYGDMVTKLEDIAGSSRGTNNTLTRVTRDGNAVVTTPA